MNKDKALHCDTVVLAIANPLVRRAMTDEFRHRAVDNVIAVADWKALTETVEHSSMDVFVADDLLWENQTGPLIRDIRLGAAHAHPFPLVLTLAHQQNESDLRALIDCGPDAIVLTPVSIADLFSKIERLAAGRKPFIITRNYVGPDRRTGLREGAGQPRVVDAPNPLGGNKDPDALRTALESSSNALKTAKMECSLDQLAFALKSGSTKDFDELIPAVEHLARSTPKPALKEAARELVEALKSKVFENVLKAGQKLLAAATGRA